MIVPLALYLFGVWVIVVVGANLNAYPSSSQEGNDYGEKHRTS